MRIVRKWTSDEGKNEVTEPDTRTAHMITRIRHVFEAEIEIYGEPIERTREMMAAAANIVAALIAASPYLAEERQRFIATLDNAIEEVRRRVSE